MWIPAGACPWLLLNRAGNDKDGNVFFADWYHSREIQAPDVRAT
ncbi:MAG: hypothetical protein AAF471_01270 [Myxococcota bacterium]